MINEKTYNNYKEQRQKLESLLKQLNQLSCKEYHYIYRGGESHQIWYNTPKSPIRQQFRYATRIEDLIKTVEILIRYRMIEYED